MNSTYSSPHQKLVPPSSIIPILLGTVLLVFDFQCSIVVFGTRRLRPGIVTAVAPFAYRRLVTALAALT